MVIYMNFRYLENLAEFAGLYSACCEAEEFVLTKPDISATSARKAMEFIVKYIYTGFEPYPAYGCTVYDMIRDPRFQSQFADLSMLDSIDFIRRAGNAAVHTGNLDTDEAMQVLQHLHFLTGEFSVGIGLISEYAVFVKPEPDIFGEVYSKIHSDNLFLNLLPYVRAVGREDWAEFLSVNRLVHIDDFNNLPEELKNDEFLDFLRGFERSIKTEVAGILELLPISSATEREWQERRSSVPESAIARVECYVEAYIADNQRGYTQKWTYYNEALGEKAAAYLWLVHPNYVPESMRGAYVKPDAANVGDTDEFISLEEAIKQLLRYIVAESPRKRDLLSLTGWCKTNLGISIPVIRTSIGSNHPDRELYSKDKVHMGDKKFYVLVKWNRNTLLRLRQIAGELRESLVTMDRIADWGFAVSGSDAEKRATERAEKRYALEMQERERKQAEEAMNVAAEAAASVAKAAEDPEASPREIRSFIENVLSLVECMHDLCSKVWCEKNIGVKSSVLISYEDGVYLRRKQMDGNYTYSRLQLQYAGKTYFVLRMRISEFARFRKVMGK